MELKHKEQSTPLISFPKLVKQIHEGIINHESNCYIQTNSAKSRNSTFIEPAIKKKKKNIIASHNLI